MTRALFLRFFHHHRGLLLALGLGLALVETLLVLLAVFAVTTLAAFVRFQRRNL